MLKSANGRHRRPRQAPTAIVTVAATGAGIALPLLGATAAQAADAGTWDRVAVCESGGMWSANPGNGFYGGLSITQETWELYDGTAYAKTPDQASRSQQIAVAEKMLAELGPEAWPGCAAGAGLTRGGAAAQVDPGVAVAPDGSATSVPKTRPATSHRGTPAGPATPTGGPVDPSGSSTTPAASGTDASTPDPGQGKEGSGTPRHAKPSPWTADAQASGTGTSDARYSGTGMPGAGAADRASRGADRGTAPSDPSYTVAPGDSLSGIAESRHLRGGWPALYHANESVVGDDPDLILPGQQLNLSSP